MSFTAAKRQFTDKNIKKAVPFTILNNIQELLQTSEIQKERAGQTEKKTEEKKWIAFDMLAALKIGGLKLCIL